ncbi:hypothetical protein HID58_046486 [Brassica napus]|uniref:Prolamin-like domain-containing protein n=1 Tax=Brassica napus TaxID=3708 RepID=A0ABQ8AXL8_BRANA|nr:hypothetical protein HID58_046486 [Brassica napus]
MNEIKRTRKKRKITNKMGSKAVVSVYLIISLCAAIFVTRGVAQMQNPQAIPGLFPPGLVPIDLVKCWSSLFTVQGCYLLISSNVGRLSYRPRMCLGNLQLIFFWKIENVEAACCKMQMLASYVSFESFFPPSSRTIVRAIPGLFPLGLVPIDLVKCWSSLFTVQGCVLAISNSFFSGKFENVEAACCKVFSTLDANCWPHMFPLNPFFPPLLKDNCARIIPNSPAHN